jgi:uncharacterized protein YecE (DUF72 family)
MTLHAGTSGWAYKEWKPDFYPQKLPQRQWLEHYCSRLGACEINATYYRLQAPDTFVKWLTSTPDDFRFAAKAHRRITHRRNLAVDDATRAFLDRYLASVSTLGNKLGAILFQFPPGMSRDDDALRSFLGALPDDRPFAVEFRDDSWSDPSVAGLIAARGGTVCVSDTSGEIPAALPPGPIGYIRLRSERYSDDQREKLRTVLLHEAGRRDVFVFAKHEGIPVEDSHGGIGLACWLVANVAA